MTVGIHEKIIPKSYPFLPTFWPRFFSIPHDEPGEITIPLFLKNLISLLFTLKTGCRLHLTSPIPVRSSASLLSRTALHHAYISADSQSWTTERRF